MKKILFAVLLICLCVALAACTATDPDNLFEIEPDNTVASTPESQEETTASVPKETQSDVVDIMYYTGAYQYGNMQKGNEYFLLFGNEVLFYDYGTSILKGVLSYDLINGEVRPVCQDATCNHKECVQSMLKGGALEVYDGKLYGTNERSYVVEVNENGAKVLTDAPVHFEFFHYDDRLYARTSDSSLVVFEEGEKEPQVAVEEYIGMNAVVFDDYLYANDGLSFIRVNLTAEEPEVEEIVPNAQGITDGQHIYYLDKKTDFLYRCDMNGSNAQLLIEEPILSGSINFDDEYFYFRYVKQMDYELSDDPIVVPIPGVSSEEEWDQYQKELEQQKEERSQYTYEKMCDPSTCYDIYRFPKEDPTKIENIATLSHPVWCVYTVPGTGKLFVSTYAKKGETAPLYVVGTDGSNPTKLEIPEY